MDAYVVVIILGVGGLLLVFSTFTRRRDLKREVDMKLRDVVVFSDENELEFDGAVAEILLYEYFSHEGGDDPGPPLSGRYLCKMPDAGVYWVEVWASYRDFPASAEVSELDETEINHVLAMYPYLKNIQKSLAG